MRFYSQGQSVVEEEREISLLYSFYIVLKIWCIFSVCVDCEYAAWNVSLFQKRNQQKFIHLVSEINFDLDWDHVVIQEARCFWMPFLKQDRIILQSVGLEGTGINAGAKSRKIKTVQ